MPDGPEQPAADALPSPGVAGIAWCAEQAGTLRFGESASIR
ncbi:hypothetical protein [Streptosporangium sp. NPDC087985]